MKTAHSLKVALVGNPNCGKTTLFNELTKSHQRVGNWAGVTVAKKTGFFKHAGQSVTVIDLPGVYSLTVGEGANQALDERIACRYLLSKEADVVINIVDAANLKRHLYLTLELLDMNVPCIIVLNMMDEAEKKQLNINCDALAKRLGCPVVPMVCRKGQGLSRLKDKLVSIQQQTKDKIVDQNLYHYIPAVVQAVATLTEAIDSNQVELCSILPINHQCLALRLLEKDRPTFDIIANTPLVAVAQQTIKTLEQTVGEDSDIVVADCRYHFITELMSDCVSQQTQKNKNWMERFDNIAMHSVWGIPFFLLIMYAVFEFSIGIGSLLAPIFDDGAAILFVDGMTYLAQLLSLPAWLTAILTQGAGVGLNTVSSFIPQIGLMFLALSFLEDSGYMARAAFVMDRLMQAIGLPGKSFIPLMIGFGCNVPSVMATRTLDSPRDRILTAMMAPFMSCGARLAIFVVFGAAFFPQHAGALIFILYVLGILVAILTAWILKLTLLTGTASPFILEVPRYHWPTCRNLMIHSWQRLKAFVCRAGKVIVPICILVGSLNTIDTHGHLVNPGNNNTVLAGFGRTLNVVLAPMGVPQDNWPATVGLFTGALAKEVVVGTLNTLYDQHSNKQVVAVTTTDLKQGFKSVISNTVNGFKQFFSTHIMNPFTANMANSSMSSNAMNNMIKSFGSGYAAFSYLLFVLLYVPCVSTVAVIAREIGVRWAWLSIFWSCSIAYTAAVICYQLLVVQQQPMATIFWVGGLLLWQGICFIALRMVATTTSSGVNDAILE